MLSSSVTRSLAVVAAIGAGLVVSPSNSAESSAESRVMSNMTDEHVWLEEIDGARALEWVSKENERTLSALTQTRKFSQNLAHAIAIVQDDERPLRKAMIHEGWIYAVTRSDQHELGLWRRVKVENFRGTKSDWQTVLDLDALSKKTGLRQEIVRTECYKSRCLLFLAEKGKNYHYSIREFDLEACQFVSPGFALAETFSPSMIWQDEDTVLVAADWGSGSLSSRGLPMAVKAWKRGHNLAESPEVFRGESNDSSLILRAFSGGNGERLLLAIRTDVQAQVTNWVIDKSGHLAQIRVPQAVALAVHQGEFVFKIREDCEDDKGRAWSEHTIASIPLNQITRSNPTIRIVLKPDRNVPVLGIGAAKGGVFVVRLEAVHSRLSRFFFDGAHWRQSSLNLGDDGTITIGLVDPNSKFAIVTFESFTVPPVTYAIDSFTDRIREVARTRAAFDASQFTVEQLWARSSDGRLVPYFLVRNRALRSGARVPTLLHAYGASRSFELPSYDPFLGKLWLQQGGAYALANVRGGGELGPEWYVRKTERRHTYEDFIGVAEDLIRRGVTSASRLGIRGHSNGGLLMGVVLNQRPDLFGAAVIENPVLDLIDAYQVRNGTRVRRATGPVIVAQHGDLSVPEEAAFIREISPYQNLRARPGFPVPFVTTSTTDITISPAMARKYVTRLASLGLEYFYFESPEGGHNPWLTPLQHARYEALVFSYLADELM